MNRIILVIIASALLFSCSKEIPPAVDFGTQVGNCKEYLDIVQTPQAKVVLIEEFSGESCVNCPAGHDKLEEIQTTYGDQVAIISMHAAECGPQADPPPGSSQDLRVDAANDVVTLFNTGCTGIPAAVFDRTLVTASGQALVTMEVGVSNWTNRMQEVLSNASIPPVNIEISDSFDASSRTLSITVKTHYTQTVTGDNNITIALTESNILTAQKFPPGTVPDIEYDYPQNHVLRKFVTPVSGQKINLEKYGKIAGATAECTFTTEIPVEWNQSEMEIVVFIHEVGGSSLKVLQAAKKHL
jgi:thiol-disulfide isomerase/thioredoxin